MKTVFVATLAIVFNLTVAPGPSAIAEETHPAAASDWINWRGPNYDGISLESDWTTDWPKDGPKQLWKASVGTGFSSFSVSRGRVYTMGNTDDTDFVRCLDANSGDEVWKYKYACKLDPKYYDGGPGATPTGEGDRVYTVSKWGHLHCLKVANGDLVWKKDLRKELGIKIAEWGIASSPLILEDLLILNAGTAGIAFKKATGELAWKTGTEVTGYATAVPFTHGGKQCVAIFAKESIYGVEAKDGKVLWTIPWKTNYAINAADPIVNGDRVFLSSAYGFGCGVVKFSGSKPELVWKNTEIKAHFSSSVLYGDHLYGIDGRSDARAQLKCLDFETGSRKWQEKGFKCGALIMANGKLIILNDGGELIVAEATPDRYRELARAKILDGRCWTPPVLSGGRLFARNAKGDAVCVDLRAAAANSN